MLEYNSQDYMQFIEILINKDNCRYLSIKARYYSSIHTFSYMSLS